MRRAYTVDEMREIVKAARTRGQRIGLVPTMGYLHDGHLSLMRTIRSECDFLVVSIFVNPTQFSPDEDLDKYPRDIDRDISLCESISADVVFIPSVDVMYGGGESVYIDELSLSQDLCGASRKGHFRGVLTVVAKLFNIVQPDVAVFGQKDAQQARLVQQMVKDLNFPIEIIVAPIVREDDGLAMSSRNTYLSKEERQKALYLNKALVRAQEIFDSGEIDAGKIKAEVEKVIAESGGNIEYIEIVDYNSFRQIDTIKDRSLLAVAVVIGSTRLIDNTILVPA